MLLTRRTLPAAVAILLAGASPALAGDPPGAAAPGSVVPGELIVRYRAGTDGAERAATRAQQDATLERRLGVGGLELVDLGPGTTVAEAERAFERDPEVLYAAPNLVRTAAAVPNDPRFAQLRGLHNVGQAFSDASTPGADIDAVRAWDVTTGSPAVTVAVVDTGMADDQPDLAPNLWSNPGESASGREANGLDDDRNGYVDDVHGWDFAARDNVPRDGNGHGTHVAGTIGARGNDGFGVAGVSWSTRLMPLRVLGNDGQGTTASLVSAYVYAARNGARIVNASLGGAGSSQAELDAIRSAPQTLFVVAAGNGGADSVGDDNDAAPVYPCNYDLPNVVCVAATDGRDELARFSNYGAGSVDLAAPGTSVLSSQPAAAYDGDELALYSGTSMATPHVAGAAALVLARRPTAASTDVRTALLAGAEPKPGLAGRTVTGGRLSAYRALTGAPARTKANPTPIAPQTPGATPAPDTTAPKLTVTIPTGQRLGSLLSRGLRVRVGCSEACRIATDLRLELRSTRSTRVRVRYETIGRASRRLGGARGGRTEVLVRAAAAGRARLARERSARLALRVEATDAAGNRRTAERRLTVSR